MRQWYDSCTRGRVGCEKSALEYVVCSTGCSIAVFRRVELGSVDEPSRSARKDDRARDSAFDLPLGTTVVARVFVHFERAVATYRVSGAREPEDVREGDRHRREFLDPDRCPRRGRYTKSTLYYTVHLLIGRTNERLFGSLFSVYVYWFAEEMRLSTETG
ncbi:conserved hypothetical protein, partial [Trichinella spiralis]|uniref:hypothetical protein n=1 Tax=Trichinella spiralis TaxID=6334 RepID=UPI0001EFE473